MNSNLYRLIYCSRNRISRSATEVTAEIQKILTSSRTNNAAHGVTGALLYNDGNFAQALEGSISDVGQIFEKVQCDTRHSEVIVVETGAIESRSFPEWSMAFAGTSTPSILPMGGSGIWGSFCEIGKCGSSDTIDASNADCAGRRLDPGSCLRTKSQKHLTP